MLDGPQFTRHVASHRTRQMIDRFRVEHAVRAQPGAVENAVVPQSLRGLFAGRFDAMEQAGIRDLQVDQGSQLGRLTNASVELYARVRRAVQVDGLSERSAENLSIERPRPSLSPILNFMCPEMSGLGTSRGGFRRGLVLANSRKTSGDIGSAFANTEPRLRFCIVAR
jgi:hypothetical protein